MVWKHPQTKVHFKSCGNSGNRLYSYREKIDQRTLSPKISPPVQRKNRKKEEDIEALMMISSTTFPVPIEREKKKFVAGFRFKMPNTTDVGVICRKKLSSVGYAVNGPKPFIDGRSRWGVSIVVQIVDLVVQRDVTL